MIRLTVIGLVILRNIIGLLEQVRNRWRAYFGGRCSKAAQAATRPVAAFVIV